MRIAFVHFPGRLARLEAARAGEGPTEFLFGGVELEREGHDVRHYEVDPAAPTGRVAQRLVDRQAGLGRLPPHATAAVLRGTRALLPELAQAEVVVGTTTGTAIALAAWRRARRLRVPLVGIVAGLLNQPWSRARRATTLPLLREMHAMLYGPGEAPGLAGARPAPRRPRACEPVRGRHVVLVAGRGNLARRGARDRLGRPSGLGDTAPGCALDRRRGADPDGTPTPGLASVERALGARRLAPAVLSDVEVRDAFRGAAAVVVPVKDVPQPSGQSVTLQASACARPVVLSRTRGLWDPDGLRDGENVMLVPPASPDALSLAVGRLLAEPGVAHGIGRAARLRVEQRSSVEGYAERLLELCRLAIRLP